MTVTAPPDMATLLATKEVTPSSPGSPSPTKLCTVATASTWSSRSTSGDGPPGGFGAGRPPPLPTLAAAVVVALWTVLSWRYGAYALPSPWSVVRGFLEILMLSAPRASGR